MYRKNELVELEITSVTNLGYGVGKNGDNPVVFVPGAVTGEKIRATIIKVCSGYCIGRLAKILSGTALRDNNQLCTAPASCGGCPYRFLVYDEELRIKRENVAAEFRKAGIADAEIMPVKYVADESGRPVIYNYRNKAQYRFYNTQNGISAGFYASGTHRITGNIDCPLQPAVFAEIAKFICEYASAAGISVFDESTGKGILRHLYIRSSASRSDICVCLVINAGLPGWSSDIADKIMSGFPNVSGVVFNINLKKSNVILGDRYIVVKGRDGISDIFCGKRFDVRMAAFYQVNHDAAELLCATAKKLLDDSREHTDNQVFLDLYCGIGTIGLSVADCNQRLIGVEIVPEAVECANKNAKINSVANCEFICADSFEGAQKYLDLLSANDIVCVDPPRKGCSAELLEAINKSKSGTLLYISCNPATLARDCAVMKNSGWTLSQIYPVNLFPRTGHVETVCLLTKNK